MEIWHFWLLFHLNEGKRWPRDTDLAASLSLPAAHMADVLLELVALFAYQCEVSREGPWGSLGQGESYMSL